MKDNTFQGKEFKENLQRYEAARAQGSSLYLEPDELTDIAEYYHSHGRLQEAIDAIETATSIFPGAAAPLAFRARISLMHEDNTEEARCYVSMISDKHDLEYVYIMAEIMIVDGQTDEARSYLTSKAGEQGEDDLEDYYLDVANLFADYDLVEDAQQWLSKCADTDEDDYQELLGRITMGIGDYTESEKIFEALIDKDPYYAPYWDLLASAQYMHNDASASLESSDFALAINPDDTDALINKANSLMLLGNNEEAISYYKRHKSFQPYSEVGDMGIAAALMAQNKLEESLRYWRKAETICSPKSTNKIDILRNESLVYASLGIFDKAFQCADKLDSLPGANKVDNEIMRGYLYLIAQIPLVASAYFKRAEAHASPADMDQAIFFIGYCYYDCGYYQEAQRKFRKLMEATQSSRWDDGWSYLARCDYELGMREAFLGDLRIAIDKCPEALRREMDGIFPKEIGTMEYYKYALAHPEFARQKK